MFIINEEKYHRKMYIRLGVNRMTKYVENVNEYLSKMKIKQNYVSKKSGIDTKKLSRILTGKQDANERIDGKEAYRIWCWAFNRKFRTERANALSSGFMVSRRMGRNRNCRTHSLSGYTWHSIRLVLMATDV